MSATGLEVFDKTLQVTNIWLNEVVDDLGPDRHFAWHVISTVSRLLRDQLPPDMAAHLGAQLPLLVRGTYYDGWRTPSDPETVKSAEEFLTKVAAGLASTRAVAPADAVTAVFGVMSRHIDRQQAAKVRGCLNESLRRLWPEAVLLAGSRLAPAEREERIRARAYELWQEEGRPGGRELDHWQRAASQVRSGELAALAGEAQGPLTPPVGGNPTRKRATTRSKSG